MNFIKRHKIIIIILIVIAVFYYLRENREIGDDHVINSLYKSDERIYKNELGPDDQKMYDLILESLVKHHNFLDIDMDEFNCYDYEDCADIVKYANEALMVDHPELMNYAGYRWKYSNGKFKLTMIPAYNLSYKDYYGVWRIERILDKIEKDTKNMNEEEKIKYVYDWMGDNNKYDYYFTYTSKNQSIYNVFIKKNAVCAGFAKASQIIFSRIGIESYIVHGLTNSEHMWNIVKYNDKYYYFDSTVAVGYKKSSIHYTEGLQQSFMNDYNAYHSEWYPKVENSNMFS